MKEILHNGIRYQYIRSNEVQVVLRIVGATLPEGDDGYRYENRSTWTDLVSWVEDLTGDIIIKYTMADICTNFIAFKNKEAVDQFSKIYNGWLASGFDGVMLDRDDPKCDYMRRLDIFDQDNLTDLSNYGNVSVLVDKNPFQEVPFQFTFSTNYTPNIEDLVKFAIKHKSDFFLDFEEPAHCSIGQASFDYEKRELSAIHLPSDFIETKLEYAEDGDGVRIKGTKDEFIESEGDVLSVALYEYGIRTLTKY